MSFYLQDFFGILEAAVMKHLKFTYWQDGQDFIEFLNDFPDYLTQGSTLDELIENLKALFKDLETDEIPYIRHVSELIIA